jgi:hypothetical protein
MKAYLVLVVLDTNASLGQSHVSVEPLHVFNPSSLPPDCSVPLLLTPSPHVYITVLLAEDSNHHNTIWPPECYI